MALLDIDTKREVPTPRDAATVVLVRDGAHGPEIFFVRRHAKSGFLADAMVFPGGKVDPGDLDASWSARSNDPCPPGRGGGDFAASHEALRALAVAACREMLEEAALLPLTPRDLDHDELLALRKEGAEKGFAAMVKARSLTLDLARLIPFARWVTPTAEGRRFDTRFYVALADARSVGKHDGRETTESFWGRPADVLARFDRGEVQLAPPTHRTLSLFSSARGADELVSVAADMNLAPICPEVVSATHEGVATMALTLPGDPEHSTEAPVIAGPSRFVLVGDRWLPADAPLPDA